MITIKTKKANTLIDIIIAIMFISTVLLFCYSLATTSINKRQQEARKRDATMVAENIMNRVISNGVYSIKNEPFIDQKTLSQIDIIKKDPGLSVTEKSELISDLRGVMPVSQEDAPFLQTTNQLRYQVIVDDYLTPNGLNSDGSTAYTKHPSIKTITVKVYYPIKVAKFLNEETSIDGNTVSVIKNSSDKISLEEETRVVTLTTLKSGRQYSIEE